MTISTSSSAPLVVIVGTTGNQGGSVLKHLAESDKSYRIRALTRDASKPKAVEIAAKGVDIFEVDIKPDNYETIVKAFTGASVVFSVTNFWEHLDAQRETVEGKAMVDAALEAKVQLFIYSGLPSPSKISDGKYTKIFHFESKATVDDYGRSKASSSFEYKTIQPAFFTSGFIPGNALSFFQKTEDGSYVVAFPVTDELVNRKTIPIIDINADYGLWVRGTIENEELRRDARPIIACGSDMKLQALCELLSKKTDKDVHFQSLTPEVFLANFPPGTPSFLTDDLIESWEYTFAVGYWGDEDLYWSHKYLARKPLTVESWAEQADLSPFN
ncbi:NAD(P)-binding protein [Boeremia exigua]|uniref:NAD(P)-binding protein n=1 Tax=Boeremia exigua TaxID=749465 RepID=UPI001E8D8B98|nr:NAD(P)-binding protein [Boeremia exigua]KAH6638722.1 NAD(P)-binding protein [Boeremia exigua]